MTAQPPLEQRPAADLMTRDLLTIAASESVLMAWELMCKAVTTLLPSRAPTTVRPSATIREAARAMLESGKDYISVTNDHGALVGLITARDLIGALAGAERDIAPLSGGMPSLCRIEPVIPNAPPSHPGHSSMPPD